MFPNTPARSATESLQSFGLRFATSFPVIRVRIERMEILVHYCRNVKVIDQINNRNTGNNSNNSNKSTIS